MYALLFLESVGTTELLVILVAALILFGPRRLPELSRSLGKSLSEFKRASDDFKQTWEREVALERVEKQERIGQAMVGAADDNAAIVPPVAVEPISAPPVAAPPADGEMVARRAVAATSPASEAETPADAPRKSDWL